MPTTDAPTAEQIALHYSAALASVTLINELAGKTSRTGNEVETIDRNVKHLESMVAQDFWTTEDLTPFTGAIVVGKAAN